MDNVREEILAWIEELEDDPVDNIKKSVLDSILDLIGYYCEGIDE